MKKILFIAVFSFLYLQTTAQRTSYTISFENAVHHEATIKAIFSGLENDTLNVRMSSSSPGRYAIHHFAKNVYNVKAYNRLGKQLQINRPDPFSWEIPNHDGEVTITYTLFANRADGTYSQVDETHAHLNMPATFMYSEQLKNRPMQVTFKPRKDLKWKVATQLKEIKEHTYWAPDLQYFMDSPTEISNYDIRSFDIDGKTIRFALHDNTSSEDLDIYFENVKKIVLAQKDVFGELPDFDFGTYTFLACYGPNISGDGMEHRNSTIVSSSRRLKDGGLKSNIGTVSHEFFHCWNVERIRPLSLEPFDFSRANMSGELWFAEGFTSYYTNLILCRAGIMSAEDYIKSLNGTFNYVWNSPARQYYNPIEMSYQAPFVDAATSIDPVNRENTFISYYSYGSVLGLALDLSLRKEGLNLDDFMKLVWNTYGKNEKPYTINDLETTLSEFAGQKFAETFFEKYIYDSQMPDYKTLFENVGVNIEQNKKPFTGISLNNEGIITRNISQNTPAYSARLSQGDTIISINNMEIKNNKALEELINSLHIGATVTVKFIRNEEEHTTKLTIGKDPTYTISLSENAGKKQLNNQKEWLSN